MLRAICQMIRPNQTGIFSRHSCIVIESYLGSRDMLNIRPLNRSAWRARRIDFVEVRYRINTHLASVRRAYVYKISINMKCSFMRR